MMRLIVLRPPERAAGTLARIAEAGGEGANVPLFALEPLAWAAPDPAAFDALALTSANAVRLAGPRLASLVGLAAWAVCDATAAAARETGLRIVYTGTADASALFAAMADAGIAHALWLTGEDRRPPPTAPALTIVETYRAAPLSIDTAPLAGAIVLIHSPRAATRLAELVTPGLRPSIHLAAISRAAADAAGAGWAGIAIAAQPNDAALVATAIDRARAHADKRAQ